MLKDLNVKYNFDIFLLRSVGIKNTFFTLDIFIERNYVISARSAQKSANWCILLMWKLHIQGVSCKINTEISLQVLSLIPWLANWWIFLTLLFFPWICIERRFIPTQPFICLLYIPKCFHVNIVTETICALFSSMKINYKYENNTWFCFSSDGLMPTRN